MRVLVVVGETEPPERLVVRADRVLHTAGPELEPQLLADVRAHIPEDVAVVGAKIAAVGTGHTAVYASGGACAVPRPRLFFPGLRGIWRWGSAVTDPLVRARVRSASESAAG